MLLYCSDYVSLAVSDPDHWSMSGTHTHSYDRWVRILILEQTALYLYGVGLHVHQQYDLALWRNHLESSNAVLQIGTLTGCEFIVCRFHINHLATKNKRWKHIKYINNVFHDRISYDWLFFSQYDRRWLLYVTPIRWVKVFCVWVKFADSSHVGWHLSSIHQWNYIAARKSCKNQPVLFPLVPFTNMD